MRSKTTLIWVLTLILSIPADLALAKFDNSSLNRTGTDGKPLPTKTLKSDPKLNKLKIDLTLREDPKKLETQIKALNLIIKTESDRSKKVDLYLRKSYLHVSVAKMLGLNRQTKANISSAEKFHLDESKKILNFLMKNIRNDKSSLAAIYNVMGLVEYEMDQQEKTVEYFKKSIELNSKSAQAETMSIYIAEYYFDIEKYNDAIAFYRLLYKQMTPYQKALADYKIAWSHINLKDYEQAEQGFIRIVKENLDKGVVEDSYKDLAFIITREKDDNIVLERAKAAFPQPQLRAKFLYFCLLFYLQQSKNNPRESIFREVFSIQDDPYERSKVLALKVSFEKVDYPTIAVFRALTNMNQHLLKIDPKTREKYFATDSHQLEEDSEVIIRLFVDAYVGKLKTRENLPKDYLGKSMITLISTHLKWFPNTTNFCLFITYGSTLAWI